MAATAIPAFWLVSLTLIAVPGADWAFVLGARAVIPAVAGLALGYLAMTAVVAAGVGALVSGTPWALTALTTAGGLYLIWLGVSTLRRPSVVGASASGGSLWQGVATSALNPKGLLIFVALLPQFADPAWSWPVAVQIAVLGLTFVLTVVAFYLGLGAVAATVLRARPSAARWTGRIAGLAMIVIGAGLLLERLL